MIEPRDSRHHDAADDVAIRLLRMAGDRPPAPELPASRVRAAVRHEWRAVVRRRARRRRVLASAGIVVAAAAILIAIGGVAIDEPAPVPAGAQVAVVEQLEGTPQRISGSSADPERALLSRHDPVRTHEWIETDARTRVALRFSGGTSVRFDAGSRARALSSTSLELAAGAVYVDTGRESEGTPSRRSGRQARFEIRTPMGSALDVGTQFEVRLLDQAVRLRVRSGAVELRDRERSVSARGGTEITMSPSGAVSSPIAQHGPEWQWTARVAPPLPFDGLSLASFLAHVAREEGWTLQYADPALGREASSIVLHGAIDGLTAVEAVDVAIASSSLRHELRDGELVVRRETEPR
jgi:ferric-dicitrate binding protein FerR (iron transport regulator)